MEMAKTHYAYLVLKQENIGLIKEILLIIRNASEGNIVRDYKFSILDVKAEFLRNE